MTRRMIHLATKLATASPSSRTITGVATTYGTQASASTGPVIIEAGSLRWAEDLSRLKLLVDHDQTQPVGYATAVTDTDDELTVTFHVPDGDDGDRALTQASNGLRDGLSVGVWTDDDGWTLDEDGYAHVTSGMLREVSLCALPAIDDARVSDVAATAHHGRNTMPEENKTPEVAPAVAATGTAPTPPAAAPAAPAPVQQAAPVTPPGTAGARKVSLRQAARIVSDVVRAGGAAADVRAALADVTSTNLPATGSEDMENPFLRDTWLGELWTASKVERPFIDLLGTPRDITGLKVYGWKWEVKPQVANYAGDKAEIPTNSPKLVPAEAGVQRIAGGWDIDRIYVDLGDASLIEALWQAAVEDYRLKTEAAVTAALGAVAVNAPVEETFAAALVSLGATASAMGANISGVGIASDLWAEFASLTRDQVPWWLGSGDNINIGTTSGSVGGTRFFVKPNLPAGEYLALDSRAATFYEKNPPVRVNAIDLAHGGVDLGLFGYHGLIVNDGRAVIKGSVVPPVDPEV
jgi:HK97 family phage prohead protease